MIEYIKDNYLWIGAVVVPIVVCIITVLFKKPERKQKIGDVNGSRNTIINGDVKK